MKTAKTESKFENCMKTELKIENCMIGNSNEIYTDTDESATDTETASDHKTVVYTEITTDYETTNCNDNCKRNATTLTNVKQIVN